MAPPHPLLAMAGMDGHRQRVEARLLTAVEAADPLVTEMAGHLVKAGGKRLRPLFAVTTAQIGGPVTDDAVLGGVAVELVHLGSLYHDDVIDEALTRRAVDSVNARWGNLRAILAGDFLLARASELAASLGTEVAALLARTITRLCEGEVKELEHAFDRGRTEADYLAAIEGKTASLFASACRIGGIVGGLDRPEIDAATAFGLRYGMAFQIVDDILDLTSTEEQLGKPAGHDIAEGIYTLPVLRALEGPGTDGLGDLLGRPLDGDELVRARTHVLGGTAVADALRAAADHVDAAVAALAGVRPSESTDALAEAARHLLDDRQLAAGTPRGDGFSPARGAASGTG